MYALNNAGCNGDSLKATIKPTMAPAVLIRPQSNKRVSLLAQANTHGTQFAVTGGSRLMTDDFFKSACLKEREV